MSFRVFGGPILLASGTHREARISPSNYGRERQDSPAFPLPTERLSDTQTLRANDLAKLQTTRSGIRLEAGFHCATMDGRAKHKERTNRAALSAEQKAHGDWSTEPTLEKSLPAGCMSAVLDYQFLEKKVRRLISWLCYPFCSTCRGSCCSEIMCRESLESFWLRRVWRSCGHTYSQYDASRGWLLSDGCRLTAGRPPVCYEYLCDRILGELSDTPQLGHLRELCGLISSVGRKALGGGHLVTLSSDQVLTRFDPARMRKKVSQALSLYHEHERDLGFSNGR